MDLASLIFSGKLIPQAPSLLMLLFPEFPSICQRLCSAAEPSAREDVLRRKAVCPGGSDILHLLGASLQNPHRARPASCSHECPFAILGLTFPPASTLQEPFLFSRVGSAGGPRSSKSLGTPWCVDACVGVSGTRGRGFVVSLNVCVFTF